MREFVINWHITESCNYRCQFCFSHWNKPQKRDLIKQRVCSNRLIDQLKFAFENRLSKEWGFDSLRINFAGGEPLIYRQRLIEVAQYCQALGISTSLITNGAYLVEGDSILNHFDMIGISIDSLKEESNQIIGRIDKRLGVLNYKKLGSFLRKAKRERPELQIKINTVVNAENYQEDLNDFIASVAPDKWKVFKMLPVITQNLSITDEQYHYFLEQHANLSHLIVSENNDEMRASYLMIDPNGRFYSNAVMSGGDYRYSSYINKVGVMQALGEIDFDLAKFRARY